MITDTNTLESRFEKIIENNAEVGYSYKLLPHEIEKASKECASYCLEFAKGFNDFVVSRIIRFRNLTSDELIEEYIKTIKP